MIVPAFDFWTKTVLRLLVTGVMIGWFFPEPAQAQLPSIEIRVPGFVFQSGKKSSRGFKLTTSDVTLPDLNAIMAPTPLPKTVPPSSQQSRQTQPQTTSTGSNQTPRFGYGSGPVVPPPADPLVPVDPGYDDPQTSTQPTTPTAPAPSYAANPAPAPAQANQVPPVGDPLLQMDTRVTIPFAHNYYPRSYLPRIPYVIAPHCIPHHHHHFSNPFSCNISRAPLCGSLTSSRNYLSGCGNSSFSFFLNF